MSEGSFRGKKFTTEAGGEPIEIEPNTLLFQEGGPSHHVTLAFALGSEAGAKQLIDSDGKDITMTVQVDGDLVDVQIQHCSIRASEVVRNGVEILGWADDDNYIILEGMRS